MEHHPIDDSENVELDLSQLSAATRLQLEDAAATSSGAGGSDRVNPANPTLHVISQEELRLDDDKLEANAQYIDLSLREGQQIRLKVPLDADPLVYARNYLQSVADDSEIMQLTEEEQDESQ